jgi:hypothetical protein
MSSRAFMAAVLLLAGCADNRPPQYEYVAPARSAPVAVAPPPVFDPAPPPAPQRSWHVVPQAEAAPPRTFDPPPHLPPQPIDPSGSYDCVGWWRLCHLWSGS